MKIIHVVQSIQKTIPAVSKYATFAISKVQNHMVHETISPSWTVCVHVVFM